MALISTTVGRGRRPSGVTGTDDDISASRLSSNNFLLTKGEKSEGTLILEVDNESGCKINEGRSGLPLRPEHSSYGSRLSGVRNISLSSSA